MKKVNRSLMGLLALGCALVTASSASAQLAAAPTYARSAGVCRIEANLEITSIHIGIGLSTGSGIGHIYCDYTDGGREVIPVSIRTTLGGVGIGISVKQAQMLATGIGVAANGGMSLTGHYALTRAAAEVVVVGADAGLSITINRDGFSIPATISLSEGLGLDGSLDTGDMDIEVLRY